MEAETKNEAENKTKNKPIKKAEKEEAVEAPSSQPVEYYMKHRINEKLIEGLFDNHRFNDSLSGAYVGKIKGRTYNLLPRGRVYEAILKKDNKEGGHRRKLQNTLIPESLCKEEKGIKNDIDPIAPTMTVNRLVLEWEEKIKLYQEKEMEFDRWRNKNLKNVRPSPVKIKDIMDDEGEVT
ncbi:hypothetical protein Tco_1143159 [Tanacetum coccineum]